MRVVTNSNLFTRNNTNLKSEQVQLNALVDVDGYTQRIFLHVA